LGKNRERDRNRHERTPEQDRSKPVSVAEGRGGQLPRLLDQSIGVDIYAASEGGAFGQGGSSRDRCRHFSDIGLALEFLDPAAKSPQRGKLPLGAWRN